MKLCHAIESFLIWFVCLWSLYPQQAVALIEGDVHWLGIGPFMHIIIDKIQFDNNQSAISTQIHMPHTGQMILKFVRYSKL